MSNCHICYGWPGSPECLKTKAAGTHCPADPPTFPVDQHDRNFAADWMNRNGRFDAGEVLAIRRGKRDDHSLVQAFAFHSAFRANSRREPALDPHTLEEAAKVAEGCPWPDHGYQIASNIRRLKGGA